MNAFLLLKTDLQNDHQNRKGPQKSQNHINIQIGGHVGTKQINKNSAERRKNAKRVNSSQQNIKRPAADQTHHQQLGGIGFKGVKIKQEQMKRRKNRGGTIGVNRKAAQHIGIPQRPKTLAHRLSDQIFICEEL